MSIATARNAIHSKFNTEWAGQTPIAWDGVEFTKPATAWVRIHVDGNTSAQAGFGDGVLHRQSGLIFVQVFIPANTGTADADSYAQDAADALQYKRLTRSGERPVRTWGATIRTIGHRDGWFQVNVEIPFDYDEVA
jgi:hypothetical protein